MHGTGLMKFANSNARFVTHFIMGTLNSMWPYEGVGEDIDTLVTFEQSQKKNKVVVIEDDDDTDDRIGFIDD